MQDWFPRREELDGQILRWMLEKDGGLKPSEGGNRHGRGRRKGHDRG